MDQSEKLREILSAKVPYASLEYCIDLWKQEKFNFTVTRERKSKLGDFRWKRDQSLQTITINGNLNPYQFLITYIHEVAHLFAFIQFGLNIPPHGQEWKRVFRNLMSPLLRKEVFPQDLLIPLVRHMQNPKATSAGDLFLTKELSKYNKATAGIEKSFLSDLKPESIFELNGRKFKKKETRRTRVLCEEIPSGKRYLISQLAEVQVES
ncbi:MAG: type IX secretion system protein SprT [Algoriphagus marincola HL-49]|uniref:Type IX secretion system protein SprT n=1 Tax=Algoriphagus marincola HL-49 TaxID=1305737 RepID=A0A0P8C3A6_9BACT|nr:MAG: type IX secretion system protein SprT [Algoriphagus marincola HL-49]